MQGTMLISLHTLNKSPKDAMKWAHYCHFHITDEGTEAQSSEVMCTARKWQQGDLKAEPRVLITPLPHLQSLWLSSLLIEGA